PTTTSYDANSPRRWASDATPARSPPRRRDGNPESGTGARPTTAAPGRARHRAAPPPRAAPPDAASNHDLGPTGRTPMSPTPDHDNAPPGGEQALSQPDAGYFAEVAVYAGILHAAAAALALLHDLFTNTDPAIAPIWAGSSSSANPTTTPGC